jgi:hypothetical protein
MNEEMFLYLVPANEETSYSLAGEAVAINYHSDPGRKVDLHSFPDKACIRTRCRAGTIPSFKTQKHVQTTLKDW